MQTLTELIPILQGIEAGKPWQTQARGDMYWIDRQPSENPCWFISRCGIRLKPWSLPDPPAGREWHRVDGWTEDDLSGGWRPVMLNEAREKGDEVRDFTLPGDVWKPLTFGYGFGLTPGRCAPLHRTKRPLPVEDPCAELKAAHREGKVIQYRWNADETWTDTREPLWNDLVQYRIKPSPVMVPLSCEDVPPGSVVRCLSGWPDTSWATIRLVRQCGIKVHESEWSYIELMNQGWEILRPGSFEWQKCERLA